MRHMSLATSFIVVVGLLACNNEPPQAPLTNGQLQGPVSLVSPADGERFKQNDATLGCPDHAARGYGFHIAFDWKDVAGAATYKIVFWHTGSPIPAVQRVVTASTYAETQCNAFVADQNLDHWAWRVAALGPAGDGVPPDTLWSEEREYGFEPCRLSNGDRCSAPPP